MENGQNIHATIPKLLLIKISIQTKTMRKNEKCLNMHVIVVAFFISNNIVPDAHE